MVSSVRDILMYMLYLVLAYLLLTNASGFNSMLQTFFVQWRSTLTTLQGR